jgi:amino acid adenylation domain-containing protein
MTTIYEFLDTVRQRDVTLWVEGDRLRYRAAKEALPPDLLAQLKERKAEVIQFLHQANASAKSQLPPIVPVARTSNLPLSFAQQRLWLLYQFEPTSTSNNLPVVVRFTGSLNVEVLKRSIQEVARRHEVLRTTFPAVNGQPTLSIADQVDIPLPVFDLRDISDVQRDEEAFQLATKEAQQPFDLINGPLLRTKLMRLQDDEYLLIWNIHGIVCDGASSDVFYQDLTTVYQAFINDKPSPLADLPIQYADFAHWQRQWLQDDVLEPQLNYWKQKLGGDLPVIQLPFDHPRPIGVQTYRGDRAALLLSKSLNEALNQLSQRFGATLFMTLLATFEIMLYRYSGQEDLLISFASAGREQVETERLIGFFSNTLMLRTNFEGNPTFRELLNRVKEASLEAYTHQNIPFEKLVEELRPEQSQMRSPLFQVKFTLNPPWSEGRGMAVVKLPDLTITSLFGYIYHGKTKYDFTLILREQDNGLGMVFDYNAEMFDASTINRMLKHFQTLLEGIVANPDQRISDLPLLTEEEQYQQLVKWNNTNNPNLKQTCIHQLFEAQVDQTPDQVAIVFQDQQLTYRELNVRANQLALSLQKLGIKPEAFVGICMEPSPQTIVAMLGILKAGGAYVPLDPADSPEHLALILEATQMSAVLTQSSLVDNFTGYSTPIVCLDVDWETIQQESQENLASQVTADNLAYIMYAPGRAIAQGVSIVHRSIERLAKGAEYARLTASETFLQHSPLSSDAATFEIWGSLLNGAKLVMPSSYRMSLQELGSTIQHHQITTLWLPTRLFHRLVDERIENLRSVQQLLIGGDTLSVRHAQKLLQEVATCKLSNVYSLTENATFTCYHTISALPETSISIPIGHPVANTQIYLLDSSLQPVPVGIPGELYVGGDGLAQGYLNQPKLTSERFIPNPLSTLYSSLSTTRLYRTGDFARYLPDGNIEFLGHLSDQRKIRGLYIELSRVETILGQHPAVKEVAVLVREDLPADQCLIAYIVPKQKQMIPSSDLRSFLKQRVPAYMVPSAFVLLPNGLPLTSNGILDRAQLPTPDLFNQTVEETFAAPRNEVELQLTRIWEKVLGIQSVGIKDNFFDLGGHSLLAVQLFAQIDATFNKKLPLSTLLQEPTIEQLANLLQTSEASDYRESLVLLRPGGSELPFFLIHDGDGEIMLYLNLANHLKPERPIYGIQPLSQGSLPILHTRIEEMAAYYLEKIRMVQPEGPYLLGGLCAGGVLSFEIARQLETQGQQVAIVAIMDAADVQAPQQTGQITKQRLSSFTHALHSSKHLPLQEQLTYRLNVAIRKIKNAVTYELRSITLNVYHQLQIRLYQYCLDHNLSVPRFLQNISVRTVYTFAKHVYLPQSYQGRVILFRADAADDSESVINLISDPQFGWGKRATAGVEVCDVPGGHSSMLQEPHVRVFADKLQAYIQQAVPARD